MLHYTGGITGSRHIKTPTNHIAMDSVLHMNFAYSCFFHYKTQPVQLSLQ